MLALFARAADPNSGGRQMPAHYGSPQAQDRHQPAPVGTQIAARRGHRPGEKIARAATWSAWTFVRRGHQQPGRFPRGDELRGASKAAGDLPLREQRLRDLGAACASRWRSRTWPTRGAAYGIPGRDVDGTDAIAVLRGDAGGRRARARAARPDADRGQVRAPHRPLLATTTTAPTARRTRSRT